MDNYVRHDRFFGEGIQRINAYRGRVLRLEYKFKEKKISFNTSSTVQNFERFKTGIADEFGGVINLNFRYNINILEILYF